MPIPSIDFVLGLSCFGLLTLIRLLYELIEVLREYIAVLREFIEDE